MFLQNIISNFISSHGLTGRPIVVALSGGIDSVAALLLCHHYAINNGLSISAIHVNHGLSPNANHWQGFVNELCCNRGIKVGFAHADLSESSGSLEASARTARYKIMSETIAEDSVLITGHHQQDQFETMLLRLLRSSGLTGLSAMKPVSDFPNKLGREKRLLLARPLLALNKDKLKTYLVEQDVGWVEDESNQSDKFDRNYLRNKILPPFTERWPNILDSVTQSTDVLQQETSLLAEYVESDLRDCLHEGFLKETCLSIKELETRSANRQIAIVRAFIRSFTEYTPSRTILSRVVNELIPAKADAQPIVELGELEIRRHQGLIYLVSKQTSQTEGDKTIDGNTCKFVFSASASFQSITLTSESLALEKVSIVFGALNASLTTAVGSKQAKTILKEKGCPAWLRSRVPLVFYEGVLIAVADFAINQSYRSKFVIDKVV